MNWKFNGLVLLAIGGALSIALWLSGQPPRTKPVREVAVKPWSERFPGVPDSYDPAKDGPVWLGPYKFVPPKEARLVEGVVSVTFQMLIHGDEVRFYGGGDIPEGGWLTTHVIGYSAWARDNNLGLGNKIDQTPAPWQYEWIPPSTVRATLPNMTLGNGKPIIFSCTVPKEVFTAGYATRDLGALSASYSGHRCRGGMPLPPGISMLFEFPTANLSEAEVPILKAMLLISQSIQEK